jgi:hypothetical protein
MKSSLLTKRQTAGIVENELKKFYLFLQVFGLLSIILLLACLFWLNVIGLIISVVQMIVIYSLYKSFTGRIKELGEKQYE